ncbi:DUF3616 domain-containing protein [Sulfurisoma sediminicola]|uniref:Uncharacterized protein DUF3616 n=1 Tax=Sulfurisoma sediminicola TaxID=1381557 RepID=A0A497XDW6_9PROT|nr:DUF3616 domain-containing protein [Sulfurisoma sediminicola]RLJ64856.1 uncharacterized protein DUF3616 [Sulfurisoma sediminicola]
MNLGPLFMFSALTGVFEPSAIQQLPDGRFLVAEDEKAHPFTLLTLRAGGASAATPLLLPGPNAHAALSKLDDLEGITADSAGFVYTITSHSRNADGEEKKSREKLIRFRIEGDRAVAPLVVKGLKAALTAAHPVLAAAAEIADVKAEGGLNIEGLEMAPDGQRLLVGFRSPLRARRALVAAIENPREIFEAGAAPRISPRLDTLDLGGHGIRGMAYVPALAGYLVISGPIAKEQTQFRLWFWSGRPDDGPRRVTVPGLPGFEHAEGVCPAIVDGQQRIVIVSDDGDRKAGRPARFLSLEPGQLRIEGTGSK